MLGIHAVILAAGASERLGFPKALARFGRRTAVQIAIENVRASALPPPTVVLGHAAEFLRPFVEELRTPVAVNSRWRRGQLSSFQAGLRLVPRDCAGFLLYPVDYPLLTAAHLRMLLAVFRHRPESAIVVPTYRGHGGHPVLFRASLRREVMALGPRQTLRDVVYRDPARVRFVPIGSNAHRTDFDTPEQYRRIARRFSR
jgi:molybdenum cofactor cytidylyltransferase